MAVSNFHPGFLLHWGKSRLVALNLSHNRSMLLDPFSWRAFDDLMIYGGRQDALENKGRNLKK